MKYTSTQNKQHDGGGPRFFREFPRVGVLVAVAPRSTIKASPLLHLVAKLLVFSKLFPWIYFACLLHQQVLLQPLLIGRWPGWYVGACGNGLM